MTTTLDRALTQTLFDERVRVSISANGVAQVTLSRPDKLNAVDVRMFEAIVAAVDYVAGQEAVRAVVLSGEGRAFCAGLDLEASADFMSVEGQGQLLDRSHGSANLFQQSALAWRGLPVPVVAALHGAVFGAGLQIALGADIRYAAPDARLSFMEMRWGLVPDMAAMVTVPPLIRSDIARELIYSARMVSGEEMVSAGLVTRLSSTPLDDALALAETIARSSAMAIRAAKRMLNKADGGQMPAAEALMMESTEQYVLFSSSSNMAALRSYLEQKLGNLAGKLYRGQTKQSRK